MNGTRSLAGGLAGALAGLALLAAPPPALAQREAAPERLRPPEALACPRSQLTLYAGTVQRYQRSEGRTTLTIATDWGTTESLTLRHPGSDSPAPWFLLQGRAFVAADWPRIESRPGRLRTGLRAAAWVCSDGGNATIDWLPPREP